MPHKIKKEFDKKLTFQKLLEAHYRARKLKAKKAEVIKFEMNLENNLTNLLRKLKNEEYRNGKYRTFYVTEPKLRMIEALPYEDRIVHQWYVEEFIKPYIVPKYIKDTFACIPERGTHKAVETMQKYMRICKRNWGDYWILKCDIKKFFYSIDTNILFEILKKHISDKKLLKLTHHLLYDNRTDPIGIPIGNYTSQFFANTYLNELDQFIKHKLKVKYYARYMDDFVMLLENKERCKVIKKEIENFIKDNLHLELNSKSKYYPSAQGLNFCGYRIWPTHRLLRTSSKRKIKRKVKRWNSIWKENRLDYSIVIPSIQSWIGHTKHSNSYNLVQKIMNKSEFIYSETKEYPCYDDFDLKINDILKCEYLDDGFSGFNNI